MEKKSPSVHSVNLSTKMSENGFSPMIPGVMSEYMRLQ